MRLFATFNGFIKKEDLKGNKIGNTQLKWTNVTYETGEKLNIELTSNIPAIFKKVVLLKGFRYVIECKEIINGKISYPKNIKKTNKNENCFLMRRIGNEFIFIKGKLKGKKSSEVDKEVLTDYLVWTLRNTDNESTIKNGIELLKKN
jgi:hypothetical protein